MLSHEDLFAGQGRFDLLQGTSQELGQFRANVRDLPQLFRRGPPRRRRAPEPFQQGRCQPRSQPWNQGQGQMIP
jgi:hypothetical protein